VDSLSFSRPRSVGLDWTVTLYFDAEAAISIQTAGGVNAQAIRRERQLVDGTLVTHPRVYGLRTNELTWDSEQLWRTYVMLTDMEAVFRSLKSELDLRPVSQQTAERRGTSVHLALRNVEVRRRVQFVPFLVHRRLLSLFYPSRTDAARRR
jgi:hypothetical protein